MIHSLPWLENLRLDWYTSSKNTRVTPKIYCFKLIWLNIFVMHAPPSFLMFPTLWKTFPPQFLITFPPILTNSCIDHFTLAWFPSVPLNETASLNRIDDLLKAKSAAHVHPLTMLATLFFHELFTFSYYLRYILSWLSCYFPECFFLLSSSYLYLHRGIP